MLSLVAVFLGLKASTFAPKNPSRVKLETVFIEGKPVPNSYRWFFTILFQISATVCTCTDHVTDHAMISCLIMH